MGREFVRHLLRETAEPVLRHDVGRRIGKGDVLVHRRDVDDPATVPLRDHPSRGPLRADEGPVEIHRERLAPVRPGEVDEGRAARRARIVDEDVDAAERVRQLVDDVGAVGHLDQVEAAHLALRAGRLDLARRLPRTGLVPVPRHPDREPVARERDRRRPADPGVGARNDRDRHELVVSRRAAP